MHWLTISHNVSMSFSGNGLHLKAKSSHVSGTLCGAMQSRKTKLWVDPQSEQTVAGVNPQFLQQRQGSAHNFHFFSMLWVVPPMIYRLLFVCIFYAWLMQVARIWPYFFPIQDLPKDRFQAVHALDDAPTANASFRYSQDHRVRPQLDPDRPGRANAAIIALCRNSELVDMVNTLKAFEERFKCVRA